MDRNKEKRGSESIEGRSERLKKRNEQDRVHRGEAEEKERERQSEEASCQRTKRSEEG